MVDILGINGIASSAGNNKLLAGYGNDIVNVDTGLGYGLNLTSSNNIEFANFLDSMFMQNFDHTPLTFNPDTNTWSKLHVRHTPKSKFIFPWNEQMYLGHIKINSTTYASRVWHSNFPGTDNKGNQTIQWGFQSGTNGSVTKNTNRFRSANSGFKTYGITVGDTLVIESGANAGQYVVSRISDDQMIEVLGQFTSDQSSITFWVGSNWFDVRTNNSDTIQGFSENSNNLLIFKTDTLYRYNRSALKTMRGPGTSSNRSIVYFPNRDVNIYFHGSSKDRTGFYLFSGTQSTNISRAIQPFIDAIDSSNYSLIVGWAEGEVFRAYVGNLTNQNSANDAYNISDVKVVMSYSIPDNKWSIDPITDVIKAAGTLRESGQLKTFLGNDSAEVFLTPSGYSFDGDPIKFAYETKVIYPRGNEVVNVFSRLKIVARDAGRVSVSYKLWGTPFDVDQIWNGLGDLKRDVTELDIPLRHSRACGIQLRFQEYGTKEPVPTIEKISIYSVPETLETPEKKNI